MRGIFLFGIFVAIYSGPVASAKNWECLVSAPDPREHTRSEVFFGQGETCRAAMNDAKEQCRAANHYRFTCWFSSNSAYCHSEVGDHSYGCAGQD